MKLFKAMATVAGLTGVSRILGVIRDILTAAILGAGPIADAFFVALKLPNLFRRITAEGAFSVSFVPLYSETLEKEGDKEASIFASNAFGIMLVALLPFTLLAIIAMPFIIYVIAPGFEHNGLRYDLTVELSRITFPYLTFMSLTALLGGILNAHDKFAPFAAAPILFNLSLIIALLYFTEFSDTAGHAMAYGIAVAGVAQFIMLLGFVLYHGKGFKIKIPSFTFRIKKLFKLMGPGVIGAGVMHINLMADLIIASLLASGAISYLYYADRLAQLPLGMVGIAVGTALLPMLSKSIAAKDDKQTNNLFNRAMEICLVLALPAAVALFIIPETLISTLFERGKFTAEDTSFAATVLMGYAIGLPAYIMVKIFSTAYWSNQDTSTPVKISIIVTVINIALSIALIFPFGVAGIAVSTGLVGWLQLFLLYRGLKENITLKFDSRFKAAILKIVFATFLMAVILLVMDKFYLVGENYSEMDRVIRLAIFVFTGMAVYAAGILGTGALKISDLKKALTK